jgi:hypothetical protein
MAENQTTWGGIGKIWTIWLFSILDYPIEDINEILTQFFQLIIAFVGFLYTALKVYRDIKRKFFNN